MAATSKHKFRHNPVFFSDERSEALDEAYKLFMEAFAEYAAQNKLTKEQVDNFKEQILSAYLEKKASYFFENKLIEFSDYLNKTISFALTKSFKDDERENITKLFYYNNKHRLVSHEQQS